MKADKKKEAYFMKSTMKTNSYFVLFPVIALFIMMPCAVSSQVYIKGHVIYQKDEVPAANATIELAKDGEQGLADRSGNFSIYLSKLRHDDTLLISSVGYETLRIPVLSAMKRSKFVLVEKAKNLTPVTVFNTRQVLGSGTESVGYFRSWNYEKTGGEIGRIIRVPYSAYQIDKIRFKVSNLCDTCLLRLHMRNVVDGNPADEILKDSVTMTIHRLTLDDKVPEFDISAYDLTFTQSQLYVSIEVLNCRSKKPGYCSFCFAGTEKGQYVYKSHASTDWMSIDDYTIHLKLFLRY